MPCLFIRSKSFHVPDILVCYSNYVGTYALVYCLLWEPDIQVCHTGLTCLLSAVGTRHVHTSLPHRTHLFTVCCGNQTYRFATQDSLVYCLLWEPDIQVCHTGLTCLLSAVGTRHTGLPHRTHLFTVCCGNQTCTYKFATQDSLVYCLLWEPDMYIQVCHTGLTCLLSAVGTRHTGLLYRFAIRVCYTGLTCLLFLLSEFFQQLERVM